MNKLNVHQLAGWFDSEGSVTYSERHGFMVTLSNTNHDIPRQFYERFGGVYNFQIGTNKPAARWSATSKKAYDFIVAILPYTIELYPRLLAAKNALDYRMKNFRKNFKIWSEADQVGFIKAIDVYESNKHMIGSATTHRQTRLLNSWTEDEQLSYLGAYFDGDGSIAIVRLKTKFAFGAHFSPSIQVNIGNRKLLDVFKAKFGGSITESRVASTNVMCYNWSLKGYQQVEKFIKQIEPYIVDKKYQFNVMNQFIESHTEFNDGSRMKKMSEEQFKIRSEMYEEVRRLKRVPYYERLDADSKLVNLYLTWRKKYDAKKGGV